MSKHVKVSESVCAGHPDKLADQISDAILDAALTQDAYARVAAETLVAKDTIILAGELSTTANLDFDSIARNVIKDNGYTHPGWGFSDRSVIINKLHQQSKEISIGVDDDGAGDQGLMYGYATNETDQYLPLPLVLSHTICRLLDEYRVNKTIPYLRPDGKAQVVVEYDGYKPIAVKHITIAVPHDEAVTLDTVKDDLLKLIITPILHEYTLHTPNDIIVNGTGVWHNPGPASDVGLTGRKIVVDTYGGAAKVGGGAFSGKDPSKVDRSGAYAARYIAKNIVANGLADRAEVCLAYYIGAKSPIIQTIDTFGTAHVSEESLRNAMHNLLDCSVKNVIEKLDLRRPIYKATSTYGHFGKQNLPWEKLTNLVH